MSFPFRIEVVDYQGNRSEEVEIIVFDGWDKVRGKGAEGVIELDLPRGLYTVRVVSVGHTWEQVFRHSGPTDVPMTEPRRSSAVPVFDTATTHEYYAYTSAQWSIQDTCGPIGSADASGHMPGRLFVFLRTLSSQHYQGDNLAAGLSLLDSRGAVVCAFGPGDVETSDDGWLALSAVAEPGSYLLRYQGPRPREMPLYVYSSWQTQLFVGYQSQPQRRSTPETGGRLRFETAAILMSRHDQSFDPDDYIAQTVDAALAGLHSGRGHLPRGIMSQLLDGKFRNPMLGLLGAHILLLRESVSESEIDIIIGNLDGLIPGSPDVQALRIIAAERFGKEVPTETFTRPPMLRYGFEAVLRQSGRHAGLVDAGSLMEAAAPNLLVDSPWATWEPVVKVRVGADEATVLSTYEPTIHFTPDPEHGGRDWVTAFLEDALDSPSRTEKPLDSAELATQLGLPHAVIERHLGTIQARPSASELDDDLTQLAGVGPKFQGVLKALGYLTFADVARIGDSDRRQITQRLGRHASRMSKWDWVGQAKGKLMD